MKTNYATKIRTPRKHHEVRIISTQHTVEINGLQIDISYIFEALTIQIFVEGKLVQSGLFHPSRLVINYVNLVEIAEHIYDTHFRDFVTSE